MSSLPNKTVTISVDTYLDEDNATKNYLTATKLKLNGQASHKKYVLLYPSRPFPLSSTISSATLKLRTTASWASGAPHQVTAYRVSTSGWKGSKVDYSNASALIAAALANPNPGTVATSVSTANAEVAIDVTAMMTDVAAGDPYYGILVEIDTTGDLAIWGSRATNAFDPKLEVEWSLVPLAPTSLLPTDGSVISVASPILAWGTLKDPNGHATVAAVHVQLDDTSDAMGSIVFDSGSFARTKANYDLANLVQVITLSGFGGTDHFKLTYNGSEGTTTYTRGTNATASAIQTGLRTLTGDTGLTVAGTTDAGPFTVTFSDVTHAKHQLSVTSPSGCTGAVTGGAYVLAAQTYYWRVKVTDSVGNVSDWSDVQSFTYVAANGVAITSPTSSLDDATPAVVWSFAGNQTGFQVTVFDNVLDKQVYDSGRVASTEQSHTIPDKFALDATDTDRYLITVYVWDDQGRANAPNSPAYQSASLTVTYSASSGAANVLTLTSALDYAVVALTLTRAAQPDFFCLRISTDGGSTYHVPAGTDPNGNKWSRLDPTDYFTSGTTYVIEYLNAQPGVETKYRVSAVVDNAGVFEETSGDPTTTITADPPGFWLIETTQDIRVVIVGINERPSHDWSLGEEATEYFPQGRQDPVRIVTSLRGYEGNVVGVLQDYANISPTQARLNLEAIKQLGPDAQVRLIVGSMNIPVRIGQLKIAPLHPTGYNVSVDFAQIDEFSVSADGLS